jgi:steroid delta-isomerase-like uncharacterized protein
MNKSKLIVEKWISLWNSQIDWDLFEELHAEDFIDCSSSGRPTNKEGFAMGLMKFIEAFPDIKTEIKDIINDEKQEKVTVRWEANGTNKKNYLGIGPTNKLTKITGIEIIEIKNNKIVKRWGEWDISSHSK